VTINERLSGAVTILDLESRFMLKDGVGEFRDTIRTLLEHGHTQIRVNFNLAYMDDAALAELVRASTTVQNHGGAIKILGLTRKFGPGLMTTTRLLTVFESYDDEPKALASFRGDQL
jgi:anti-sigma B factor antagonist